ncbi:MAG: hypothetical protein EAZ76_02455 [Nostocales cyanobacterium]|nr:MAG: hypothetical protein EAZ87_05245 [Nostocales cyanobacterium]TAF19996.1 MAG: hypothetical protein EAZ76_02455 [Nostocales cyanobacterium]
MKNGELISKNVFFPCYPCLFTVPSPQSPVPSPQSPVTSPQSPVPSHQSPVPSPQSPITFFIINNRVIRYIFIVFITFNRV